jgi:hypothetical protein
MTLHALTEVQRSILHALLAEGGLSTAQIMLYFLPALPNWRIYRELHRLRNAGLIRSTPFYPLNGHKSEVYWTLCAAGSRVLGHDYPHQHQPYRLPTPRQIAHKTSILEVCTALQDAGWNYVRPVVYNRCRPKPALTPQSEIIRRAIQQHFDVTPATLPSAEAPPAPRLHPDHVPPGLNDWVAWHPTRPDHPIILVLHPPGATRGFWVRPLSRRQRHGRAPATPARAYLYRALAPILPVLAIFPSAELVAEYNPVLNSIGLQVGTYMDLLRLLPGEH